MIKLKGNAFLFKLYWIKIRYWLGIRLKHKLMIMLKQINVDWQPTNRIRIYDLKYK